MTNGHKGIGFDVTLGDAGGPGAAVVDAVTVNDHAPETTWPSADVTR